MAFRINTNVASLTAQRWLGYWSAQQSKALERLSSGYRINRAADDPAGIAIVTKLKVQAVSIDKSIENGNQAISMLQTAEGGMDQISNILTRLKEIATQSASDNTTDRTALDEERSRLEEEISKIAQNTRYGSTSLLRGAKNLASTGSSLTAGNGILGIDVSNAASSAGSAFTLTMSGNDGSGNVTVTLTNGATTQTVALTGLTGLNHGVASFTSFGVKVTLNAAAATITTGGDFTVGSGASSFDFQLGDSNDPSNQVTASIKNFDSGSSDVLGLTGSIVTKTDARAYMDSLDKAIDNLTTERGKLGATMNQISYHVANLETTSENIEASISTIRDADFAKEMANFVKAQIMVQASMAMLAQANAMPRMILTLLEGLRR